MKPVKLDKPKLDKPPTTSALERIGAGFFWLLLSGTLAAKVLLLVDNDLEITTKFSGKNWQINIQPLRKYALGLNNFVDRQFSPIANLLHQQSDRLIARTGNILATRKDWCIPISQLPTILIHTKRSTPIFFDDTTLDRADRLVILPDTNSLPSAQPPEYSLDTAPAIDPKPVKDWCITTGSRP